jgi:hypothetical protein
VSTFGHEDAIGGAEAHVKIAHGGTVEQHAIEAVLRPSPNASRRSRRKDREAVAGASGSRSRHSECGAGVVAMASGNQVALVSNVSNR